jgi:hypothetical protein
MNLHAFPLLPLALTAVIATTGCNAPDPTVECARLATDLQGVVARSTKPPIGLTPSGEFDWYRREGEILANLRSVSAPYGKQLNTADPITFCESLTSKNPLPTYPKIPNPFRVRF